MTTPRPSPTRRNLDVPAARQRIEVEWDKEEKAANAIARARPARILVVSDLHLSGGRDPATRGWDNLENFMADDAFKSWLEYERKELGGTRGLLVLNGDVFDFVRVMHLPRKSADLENWRRRLEENRVRAPDNLEPSASERSHGLGTHEHQIVYKLDVLTRGHAPFVAALAGWLANGHDLLITVGNHDVELAWPGVRRALRSTLLLNGAPLAAARSQLAFVADAITIKNLHVEHGHVHERMTRVGGDVLHSDGQIRLPFGSLANRYLINHLERMSPFLDNIKPSTSAITTLLRRHPLAVFEVWVRSFAFIGDAWKTARGVTRLYALLVTLALAAPIIVSIVLIVMAATGSISFWLALPATLASPLVSNVLPYGLAAAREVHATLRVAERTFRLRQKLRRAGKRHGAGHPKPKNRYLSDFERSVRSKMRSRVKGSYDVAYAVVGHTHEQGVTILASPDDDDGPTRRELLINTGTWIALWPLNRPDLMGRVHYTLAQFTWDDNLQRYGHQLLEWDDQAKARRATSFYTTPDDVPDLLFGEALEGAIDSPEPPDGELDLSPVPRQDSSEPAP